MYISEKIYKNTDINDNKKKDKEGEIAHTC